MATICRCRRQAMGSAPECRPGARRMQANAPPRVVPPLHRCMAGTGGESSRRSLMPQHRRSHDDAFCAGPALGVCRWPLVGAAGSTVRCTGSAGYRCGLWHSGVLPLGSGGPGERRADHNCVCEHRYSSGSTLRFQATAREQQPQHSLQVRMPRSCCQTHRKSGYFAQCLHPTSASAPLAIPIAHPNPKAVVFSR